MTSWRTCKKILCVRQDNMGDLLMSSPAIRALKKSFQCHITLLTSSAAKGISAYIDSVDEVIELNVPWVKGVAGTPDEYFKHSIETIRAGNFDAAVIFTVFSQCPLPAALLVSLAGVPNRLAYCRENPYELLSHWVPEREPYTLLRNQVRRDLDLVKTVGAHTDDDRLELRSDDNEGIRIKEKISRAGADPGRAWLVFHPGVSEKKREYPANLWIETGKKLVRDLGYQVIVTGTEAEKPAAELIACGIGNHALSLAGALSLGELISLIRFTPLLISVNSGPAHIAAATRTTVIVLYALTNPQHAPWKAVGKILPFSIPAELQSRNEILGFVEREYFAKDFLTVMPEDIYQAAHSLLVENKEPMIDELVLPFKK